MLLLLFLTMFLKPPRKSGNITGKNNYVVVQFQRFVFKNKTLGSNLSTNIYEFSCSIRTHLLAAEYKEYTKVG